MVAETWIVPLIFNLLRLNEQDWSCRAQVMGWAEGFFDGLFIGL